MRRIAVPTLCCILTLTLFRAFFFLGYVPSSSMEPTIRHGTFILTDRTAFWFTEPEVGDIIVFKHDGKLLIKRIIAIGGEQVIYGGKAMIVPERSLFVLGDNVAKSVDSRYWNEPFVSIDDIIAKYRE